MSAIVIVPNSGRLEEDSSGMGHVTHFVVDLVDGRTMLLWGHADHIDGPIDISGLRVLAALIQEHGYAVSGEDPNP